MKIVLNGKTIHAYNVSISSNNLSNNGYRPETSFGFETNDVFVVPDHSFNMIMYDGNTKISGDALIESYTSYHSGEHSYKGLFIETVTKEEVTRAYITLRELKMYDINQVLN